MRKLTKPEPLPKGTIMFLPWVEESELVEVTGYHTGSNKLWIKIKSYGVESNRDTGRGVKLDTLAIDKLHSILILDKNEITLLKL
jgi:hypothetical protein